MQLSEHRQKVFLDRYSVKDEGGEPVEHDVTQMWERVAVAAAKNEQSRSWQDRFANLLEDFKFVPGGRIMAGLGTDKPVTLYNCFVIPSPDDSRGGILDNIKLMVEIMSRGGGVGVNLSTLRPKGSYIKTVNGRSSGPVAWMELYSCATGDVIQQGGSRRGALMLMLDDNHPDIIEFISRKARFIVDEDGFKRPEFLEHANISVAISNEFMQAVENGLPWRLSWKDTTYNTLDARDLLHSICQRAWESADPGVVFMGRCRDLSNSWYFEDIKCVNPCVTGETLIATLEGPRSIESLVGQDTLVYAWDKETKQPVVRMMRNIRRTRQATPLTEVEFDSGLKLRCTPDHHVYTFRGTKIKVRDLRIGQSIRAFAVSTHRDGHLRAHAGNSSPKYVSRLVYEQTHGPIPDNLIVDHIDEDKLNNQPDNLQLLTLAGHNRKHYPNRHANGLKGWDVVPDDVRIKISEGVSQHYAEGRNHKVVAIREAGYGDVFNGTVDDVHTYIICDPQYRGASEDGLFSGIVSANCGEQPLGSYGVCNLGSMNLSAYVDSNGGFQYGQFVRDVETAVRFMDNVIDLNHYFLPQNERVQKWDIRRCGLGTMGLADCLIKMKVRYGSPEAQAFTAAIFETLSDTAYRASARLARERGTFEKYDKHLFAKSRFLDTFSIDLKATIARNGLRNCFLTTQAPTGTTSLLAGVSSGIEPNFDFVTHRRDRTGEHVMRHPLFQKWLDEEWQGGIGTPDYFVKSEDVSVDEHISMQAAAQKFIDSSISKTINLKNGATVGDIERAYLKAWEMGCKGITVYRDGSRDAVLTHLDKCPSCGDTLRHEEGCSKCPSCEYSACEVKH
jgi:ribonucleotide reductase alpha subunit